MNIQESFLKAIKNNEKTMDELRNYKSNNERGWGINRFLLKEKKERLYPHFFQRSKFYFTFFIIGMISVIN